MPKIKILENTDEKLKFSYALDGEEFVFSLYNEALYIFCEKNKTDKKLISNFVKTNRITLVQLYQHSTSKEYQYRGETKLRLYQQLEQFLNSIESILTEDEGEDKTSLQTIKRIVLSKQEPLIHSALKEYHLFDNNTLLIALSDDWMMQPPQTITIPNEKQCTFRYIFYKFDDTLEEEGNLILTLILDVHPDNRKQLIIICCNDKEAEEKFLQTSSSLISIVDNDKSPINTGYVRLLQISEDEDKDDDEGEFYSVDSFHAIGTRNLAEVLALSDDESIPSLVYRIIDKDFEEARKLKDHLLKKWEVVGDIRCFTEKEESIFVQEIRIHRDISIKRFSRSNDNTLVIHCQNINSDHFFRIKAFLSNYQNDRINIDLSKARSEGRILLDYQSDSAIEPMLEEINLTLANHGESPLPEEIIKKLMLPRKNLQKQYKQQELLKSNDFVTDLCEKEIPGSEQNYTIAKLELGEDHPPLISITYPLTENDFVRLEKTDQNCMRIIFHFPTAQVKAQILKEINITVFDGDSLSVGVMKSRSDKKLWPREVDEYRLLPNLNRALERLPGDQAMKTLLCLHASLDYTKLCEELPNPQRPSFR